MKDIKFYIDELLSKECRCGRTKKKHYSFCYHCYKSLPFGMQRDLYFHVGDGYEEAYEAAVRYLSD